MNHEARAHLSEAKQKRRGLIREEIRARIERSEVQWLWIEHFR